MSDSTNDNDIDALLRMLNTGGWGHYHSALTALVAERDELLKENVALRDRLKAKQDEVLDRAFEMDALRKRVAELEAQQHADSDRRERDDAMVEWMMKATTMLCDARRLHQNECWELVSHRDAAIAAMRKEGGGA